MIGSAESPTAAGLQCETVCRGSTISASGACSKMHSRRFHGKRGERRQCWRLISRPPPRAAAINPSRHKRPFPEKTRIKERPVAAVSEGIVARKTRSAHRMTDCLRTLPIGCLLQTCLQSVLSYEASAVRPWLTLEPHQFGTLCGEPRCRARTSCSARFPTPTWFFFSTSRKDEQHGPMTSPASRVHPNQRY